MPTYDNSRLQTFKNCPESYRLKYLQKLRKIQEDSVEHDRNFGSAIHAGLEAHYKGQPIEVVKKSFVDNYPIQLNGEDLAKTQENGLILLDAYIKHYAQEDKGWTIRAVEVKDKFLIGEVEFVVKIDLVVEKQGCIYFVDHKTTGKTFNWTYWQQFEPNSQITAYTAYCQAKYGECSGGIINAIQLGHRQKAYKGEPAGFHYSFQRQLFNRNRQQVEAWKLDQLKWVKKFKVEEQIEMEMSDGGVWTKNEGQCRFCSYQAICISCNDEQIKEQLYEVHNPEAYLEGEAQ